MQVNIGEKIKGLRKRDGRKQEELALALGVTPQAVSRWEANTCYPDMGMIPAIANYFHITIDELFGYNNDRNRKIEEYREKAFKLMIEGKHEDECIELLKRAIEEFPAEIILRRMLANSLQNKGFEEYKNQFEKCKDFEGAFYEIREEKYSNKYLQEAVNIYENLIEDDMESVSPLISIYSLMGEYEKAVAVAKKQQSICHSREIMLGQIQDPKREEAYLGGAILSLLHALGKVVETATMRKEELRESEIGLANLEAVVNLYEVLIPKEKYGMLHSDMCFMMLRCCGLCSRRKNYDAALKYFERATAYYENSEVLQMRMNREIPMGPLFEKVEKEDLASMPMVLIRPEMFMYHIKNFPKNIQKLIKEDSRYSFIFESEQK